MFVWRESHATSCTATCVCRLLHPRLLHVLRAVQYKRRVEKGVNKRDVKELSIPRYQGILPSQRSLCYLPVLLGACATALTRHPLPLPVIHCPYPSSTALTRHPLPLPVIHCPYPSSTALVHHPCPLPQTMTQMHAGQTSPVRRESLPLLINCLLQVVTPLVNYQLQCQKAVPVHQYPSVPAEKNAPRMPVRRVPCARLLPACQQLQKYPLGTALKKERKESVEGENRTRIPINA
ncbi:hypothetical protein C0Q70_11488 [Pomacea canaliculata]|uniref:Uncharacterized protein n=1 Tax=Pomacea canaliculata TaxID=400727 RepID=A0A2T7P672_POMCA|nr:hypothetical protein C0Q70_11488 [Pomacea canaliculata]